MSIPISNNTSGIQTQIKQQQGINPRVSSQQTNTPSFKGGVQKTEDGTPYLKTYSGLKIAGVMAALSALYNTFTYFGIGLGGKYFKNVQKTVPLVGALSVCSHLACGAITDAVRNNQAKKAAQKTAQQNNQKLLPNDNNPQNKNNKTNYISRSGLMLGAGLGAIVSALKLFVQNKTFNKELGIKINVKMAIPQVIGSAIVGLLLGKLADNMANTEYRKNNLL